MSNALSKIVESKSVRHPYSSPSICQKRAATVGQKPFPGSQSVLENMLPLQDPEEGWLDDVQDLPLHAALLLIEHGLECLSAHFLQENHAIGSSQAAARECANSNIRQLLLCALGCLFSEEDRMRQIALKGLLPVLESSAGKLDAQLHRALMQAIWVCARQAPSVLVCSCSRNLRAAALVERYSRGLDWQRSHANKPR